MTTDIKDIAHMMGVEFANAVKLAERVEAEEIDSIIKSMDQAAEIYFTRLAESQKHRRQLMDDLEKCQTLDDEAIAAYQDEKAQLANRLEQYRRAKLGNEAQEQIRGKARFGVVG